MPLLRLGSMVMALAATVAGTLHAQSVAAADGVWYGAGVALGSAKVGCDICAAGRESGLSAQVRVGGTLRGNLLLGLEGNAWMKNDAEIGVRDMLVGVGLSLYWYPNPAGTRYFVKAGLGPMFFRAEDSDVEEGARPDEALTSTALGGHFGIGYEILAGGFSLAPFMNFAGSIYGDLTRDNTTLTDVDLTLLQIGVGVIRR